MNKIWKLLSLNLFRRKNKERGVASMILGDQNRSVLVKLKDARRVRKLRKSQAFYSAQVTDAECRLEAILRFFPQYVDVEEQVAYWVEAARTLAAVETLYLPDTANILKLQLRNVAQTIYEGLDKAGERELRDDFAQDFLHLLVPAAEE